jgi:hypothetical protein
MDEDDDFFDMRNRFKPPEKRKKDLEDSDSDSDSEDSSTFTSMFLVDAQALMKSFRQNYLPNQYQGNLVMK